MARVKLSVENELATELGHDRDAMLRALAERAGVEAYLRGNELTLDGDDAAVERARSVMDELAQLVAEGVSVGPQTVDAVAGVLTADGRAVDVLHDVVWTHRGKQVSPKTIGQKRYVDAIRSHDMVFGIGPAGTGKSFLAVATAVSALMKREVARIILTRPAVEAGERLGFLPGDLYEKVHPYLRPLYDALYDMLEAEKVAALMEKGAIEIAPLAYMRGRTLNDAFIILDEAQNSTTEQMKMFLTRLGFNSKMVITGDVTQVDLPSSRGSGLIEVQQILKGVPGISFVYFTDQDVVRHRLVSAIIRAYGAHEERREDGASSGRS
jgi:phosphate starvation-inducible protein PhoH and related proteins